MARWLLVPLALGVLTTTAALTACDCFLDPQGHVVDCETMQPLAGVTIGAHDDMGLSQGQTLPDMPMTDAEGAFYFGTGWNCGDWVTLHLTKPGYANLDLPVKGQPPVPLALCLEPTR
jgi:hypothetical protein